MTLRKIHHKNRLGFTVIEVLVVIIVIGILAAITISLYANHQERSRNDLRASKAHIIANALEEYYLHDNSYPSVHMMTVSSNVSAQDIANRLRLNVDDLVDPSAPSGTQSSIVRYQDYQNSTEPVFRYRGLPDEGTWSQTYDCITNTRIASLPLVASLEPILLAAAPGVGYCNGFILSYRDTLEGEWKNIYSRYN